MEKTQYSALTLKEDQNQNLTMIRRVGIGIGVGVGGIRVGVGVGGGAQVAQVEDGSNEQRNDIGLGIGMNPANAQKTEELEVRLKAADVEEDADEEEDDEDEGLYSPDMQEISPLVRPSNVSSNSSVSISQNNNHHYNPHRQHSQHQPLIPQITNSGGNVITSASSSSAGGNNRRTKSNLSLSLTKSNNSDSPFNGGSSILGFGGGGVEKYVPLPNETYNMTSQFQNQHLNQNYHHHNHHHHQQQMHHYKNHHKASNYHQNYDGGSMLMTRGNGKPGNSMGLNNDEEQYSSSSPFHSAAEDFGGDNDHDRDRDPLIKPPPKQGGFHQLLSVKIKNKSSSSGDVEGGGGSGSGGGRCGNDKDRTEDGEGSKRKCSVGIFLAAISCIFFATSALIVKVSELHPMELLGVRGFLQAVFVTPIVISTKSSFVGPKGSRSLLLSRAVLGSVALVMSFASIHLIPLADAATVIFTSPVFVSIFACLCLGEVCSWFDVAMIALTLLGVLLVSKPSFGFISSGSWTSIVGTFCGLAAAMLTALAFIVLRQLKHVHYSVTVFWFSTVLASFGAVLTIALDGFTVPSDWRSICECIGIGVCGFLGQILLTKALQMENAGPVAVARTMDIVLAFFYQITLLHDTPDWYSYLGSVLVVSCVLLTAFRRWYKDAKRSDKSEPIHRERDRERERERPSHHH